MRNKNRPRKIMGYTLMILGLAFALAPRVGVEVPAFLSLLGWALIAVGLIVWSVRFTSLRP